ncbi:MAG: hypothetical protein Tsb0010_00740 [Parvularculaceae bacterium]
MTIDFILGHYNYWIVIILMMTGLYIVVSRGNLVKKIIGLNVFQTSVFLLYITIGKVACGTAPILIEGEFAPPCAPAEFEMLKARQQSNLRHFEFGDAGHAAPHGENDAAKIANIDTSAARNAAVAHAESVDDAEHGAPAPEGGAAPANETDAFKEAFQDAQSVFAQDDHDADEGHGEAGAHEPEYADALYSNPLPHVLILTAIVVGVATTAVGLAIAVRIREAYGAIEEDELQAADDDVEFGRAPIVGGAG